MKTKRKKYNYLYRYAAILLLAVCCMAYKKASDDSLTIASHSNTDSIYRNVLSPYVLPLDGGCITSGSQCTLSGTPPSAIIATAASGGTCSGNYLYQWQMSTDNFYFSDIPGATSQNLNYSGVLTRNTWFQRKTTCGSEVRYTSSAEIAVVATIFYNEPKSGSFIKNNCAPGGVGSTHTYTVPDSIYSSCISQEDADAKAQADVDTNGQNYANNTPDGYCTFYSAAKSDNFTKNNCASGGIGSSHTYTVEKGKYSSTISQEDADQKAINDLYSNGQDNANRIGICTWWNNPQRGDFTRNNCQSGAIATTVTYPVPANVYSSTISQEDANQKAINDVNANGQTYANSNGQCINIFVTLRDNGGSPGTFGIKIKNSSGTVLYGKTLDSDQLPFSAAVPAGNYIVEMASQNPIYAIVNGVEKSVYSTTSWNTGNIVNIQVSQTKLFRNEPQSRTFTKNNCGSGYIGSSITYTVPEGKHTSTISQEDANQKAIDDVNTNGQAYANAADPSSNCTLIQNVTVTLTNAYSSGYPYPVTVDFIQNGVTKYTGTFSNSRTGSASMTVQAGTYTLRFTVPSSWENAPMSFTLTPPGTSWSKGINSNQTVISSGTVTLNYGTNYILRAANNNIQ